MKARCWARLCAGVALLLSGGTAQAHTLSLAHLDVTVPATGRQVDIDLDLALRDIALTLPLDSNRDEKVSWGELLAAQPALESMVRERLAVSGVAGACEFGSFRLGIRRYDDGVYANLRFAAACISVDGLQVDYRLLFDSDPQHRALVTIRRGGTLLTGIASSNSPRVRIAAGAGGTFVQFVREGIHHILIGYDHLAFLLSLLLPAALLRVAGRWLPSPGIGASFRHVLGIVTAFTVAHSITLSLASLGWVTPASRWVEAAIAASVLLAALNNLWPVVTRRTWLVAFGFGLIHGFGFAGALLELGLPTGTRLSALVGFNVGVELGQLAVVTAVLPLLFALRRRDWYGRWAMPASSLLIAALAAYWLQARVLG